MVNSPRFLLVLAAGLALAPATATAGRLLDVHFERQGAHVLAVIDLESAAPLIPATAPDGLSVLIALPDTDATPSAPRSLDTVAPVTGFGVGPGSRPGSTQVLITASRPIEVVAVRRPPQGGKGHRVVVEFAASRVAAPASAPPPVAATPAPPPALASPAPAEARPPGRRLEIPEEARPAPLPPAPAPPPVDTVRIERSLAEAAKAQEAGDTARALTLYHDAADAGGAVGAFALGQIYRLGAGVEVNPTLAAFWYGEAAKAGYPPAEMNLGVMQLRGLGLHPNPAAGLAMIRRAAAHGNAPARALLDEIERAQPGDGRKGAP